MSTLKVQTFKASPAVVALIDSLTDRLKINKSKVIRMAIIKMYADTEAEEGTE